MHKKIFLLLLLLTFFSNIFTAQNIGQNIGQKKHTLRLHYIATTLNGGGGISYHHKVPKIPMTVGLLTYLGSGRFMPDLGNVSGTLQSWGLQAEMFYYLKEVHNEWYGIFRTGFHRFRPDDYPLTLFGRTAERQKWNGFPSAMIGIGYEYRLGISHLGVTANMGYVSKYNDFKENIITLISLNIGFIL